MDLTDNEKLIAAIWTASMLQGKSHSHEAYFETYDRFLDMMSHRKVTPLKL
jgi:hypothetical protein